MGVIQAQVRGRDSQGVFQSEVRLLFSMITILLPKSK